VVLDGPAGIARWAGRFTASRAPRVAAALSAVLMLATLTGAARQPAVSYPVQAAFTPPGPYATATGTVTGASGTAVTTTKCQGCRFCGEGARRPASQISSR
jgi:hypothetical protein